MEETRMEIVELTSHPYYVGVQFHPEYLSRPLKPSPPFMGLVLASAGKLKSYMNRGCRLSPREMSENSSGKLLCMFWAINPLFLLANSAQLRETKLTWSSFYSCRWWRNVNSESIETHQWQSQRKHQRHNQFKQRRIREMIQAAGLEPWHRLPFNVFLNFFLTILFKFIDSVRFAQKAENQKHRAMTKLLF